MRRKFQGGPHDFGKGFRRRTESSGGEHGCPQRLNLVGPLPREGLAPEMAVGRRLFVAPAFRRSEPQIVRKGVRTEIKHLSGKQKRLIGKQIDIGAYEANTANTVLILK